MQVYEYEFREHLLSDATRTGRIRSGLGSTMQPQDVAPAWDEDPFAPANATIDCGVKCGGMRMVCDAVAIGLCDNKATERGGEDEWVHTQGTLVRVWSRKGTVRGARVERCRWADLGFVGEVGWGGTLGSQPGQQ